MNKPVYLGLSILEISKILKYEFWYDYVKLKYGEKAKLWDMDLHGYRQLYSPHKNRRHMHRYAKDVETRFDTSSYEVDRALSEGKS